MNVGGLCQVCSSADADHRCDRCGGLVCADHHDDDHDVCVECVAELGVGRGDNVDRTRDDADSHPDVDHYEL